MLDKHQYCMPLAASSAGRQLYRWSHQWDIEQQNPQGVPFACYAGTGEHPEVLRHQGPNQTACHGRRRRRPREEGKCRGPCSTRPTSAVFSSASSHLTVPSTAEELCLKHKHPLRAPGLPQRPQRHMQKLTLLQRGAVQLCCLPSRQPQMWQGADSLRLISNSQCGRNTCFHLLIGYRGAHCAGKVKACLAGQRRPQEHSLCLPQLQSPKARCRSARTHKHPLGHNHCPFASCQPHTWCF